jgi:type I restriction enzyme S subunit
MTPVPAGTLLYSFKLSIGKMAVTERELFTNEAIAALVPRELAALDRDFLRLALMTVDAASGSSVAVKGRTLNRRKLASLPIPWVPAADQRRIAARLTEQLASNQGVLKLIDDQAIETGTLRGRIYETAFGGAVPFDVRPRPTHEPGWRWELLTDIARLESGHTPSRSHPEWWGGDIPWLALPDIRAVDGRVVNETTEYTNPEGIANSAARVLREGTIAMSRTASVGFVTKFGRPMATSQDFVNWVCGPELDPDFLLHLLIRSREQIRALASGAVHKTVYYPTVKAFRVAIPSLEEQRRIVTTLEARLSVLDSARDAIAAERAATESLPAALLRQAFAGL